MKTQLLLALSLLVTGCADYAMSSKYTDEAEDTGFGADIADTASDADGPQASYFVMSGSLMVSDGVLQDEDTVLQITFLDEQGVELCSANPEIAQLEQIDLEAVGDDPSTSELSLWAHVRFSDAVPMDCTYQHPAEFFFGVGAMNSLLLPALSASGLGEQVDSLFGLYYQRDEDSSLFVYGVAGSEENFDGTAYLADGAVPEGELTLLGLHSLPL